MLGAFLMFCGHCEDINGMLIDTHGIHETLKAKVKSYELLIKDSCKYHLQNMSTMLLNDFQE